MVPLILIYELSIWLASALGRPAHTAGEELPSATG
jgi:Sec-independent protein secretion pathway component TatC